MLKLLLSNKHRGGAVYLWVILITSLNFLSGVALHAKGTGIFDVYDYGAGGDGRTLDTQAIQAAIDDCTQKGGGKVCLHNGKFLSGTLFLKNDVTLYLEAGATLLGSTNLGDYPVTVPAYRSYTDKYTDKSLIYAERVENIGLAGQGAIDGQGGAFKGKWKKRPYCIRVVECKNVRVEGIRLTNSPMWMQHYLACDKVVVRGITVYNHCNKNNDMIDIDGCRDVIISDCIGDTDDDGLTLKSTSSRACANVTITNCILSSHCNALKMGTESSGGFKNITISNCVIRPSQCAKVIYGARNGVAGVALMMVDGGILEGITISNISIADITNPLFLRLGNRGRKYKQDMETPGVGKFCKVKISNVIATGAGDMGLAVFGIPGHPIEDISLNNIQIIYKGGGTSEQTFRNIPEKEKKYPEAMMFGTLPAYGFFVRHAKNIKFHNVTLGFEKADHRPALMFDDVQDLDIFSFEAQSTPETHALIWLKQVSDAFIHGCRPQKTETVFINISGEKSRNITITNNDFSRVKQSLRIDKQVNEASIFCNNNRK